jgi:hypothetical protein
MLNRKKPPQNFMKMQYDDRVKVVINIGCVIFIISEGHVLKYYVNIDVLSPTPPTCHAIFQAVSC